LKPSIAPISGIPSNFRQKFSNVSNPGKPAVWIFAAKLPAEGRYATMSEKIKSLDIYWKLEIRNLKFPLLAGRRSK
jgi:hypothetical protein